VSGLSLDAFSGRQTSLSVVPSLDRLEARVRSTWETIVIGAGQAGLAASYFLSAAGREHVVLERGRVAESWRSRRWDSFTLVGPNWSSSLPGGEYRGPDPDGYMGRDELVAQFARYAASFGAPVQRANVRLLYRDGHAGRYVVHTDEATMTADNVIVATGPYQRATIPPASRAIDPRVQQVHTDSYRRPAQLREGAVLVVGSGQSGCQIAEELLEAGRTVYLATSGCGWYPRWYRGKDNMWWRHEMGFFDQTIDALDAHRLRTGAVPVQTGRGGGRDLNLRTLARKGARLAGHFAGARDGGVVFSDDLDDNLARSDKMARDLVASIDGFIAARGLRAPVDTADLFFTPRIARVNAVPAREISAIVWATGYELDFGWIQLPVLDEHGYPVQRQGVTAEAGLYFLGLHWMHTRKSGIILGAGRDACHVVDHLTARASARAA
jgi:putative flavoprotein involved in K+ transport